MGAPVSVLALNELDANQLQPRPNLCYFSLSPEDEAQNAAAYMKAEGKQMPLVLVPANAFGDRIAKAFAQGWQEKGGGTVLMQTFGSVPSLKESINRGRYPYDRNACEYRNTIDRLTICRFNWCD